MIERPDGLVIAFFFILAIVVTSLISRATRSTELRVTHITLDDQARRYINEATEIHLIANEPHARDRKEYVDKAHEAWELHRLRSQEGLLFLEVTVPDASEFESELRVIGEERHGFRILRVESPTIANAIAAILLHLRDLTGKTPARLLPLGGGQPHRRAAAVSRLRRRRCPPAHPRGPAAGRTRRGTPPSRPCRLTRRGLRRRSPALTRSEEERLRGSRSARSHRGR